MSKKTIVAICVPSYADPTYQFVQSFRRLVKPFAGGTLDGLTHVFETNGMVIEKARNTLTQAALDASPEASHILWIDDDMTFPPTALERLLSHNLDIVGGLCFNRRPPYQPILMRNHDAAIAAGQQRFGFCYHYPPDGLFDVDATGGAFILVHRRVYEAIGGDWYTPANGLSEDLSFCVRVKNAGFNIFVDTGVKTGHVTQAIVTEEFASRNREYQWDAWLPLSEVLQEGEPLASVVIPAFDQDPKYLKAAILSAAYQSVPVEVIVIDDGSLIPISTEGWPENVTVIRQDNKGIAAALNAGIERMNTPWFCWLSSDDYFDPNKVERQLAACEQGGFKASFTRWQALYDDDKHTRVSPPLQFKSLDEQNKTLEKYCAIFGSTIMVHRDAIEHVGRFDTKLDFSQDWEWFKRVGMNNYWYGLQEILTTRREGAHNLTAKIARDEKLQAQRDAEDRLIRGEK